MKNSKIEVFNNLFNTQKELKKEDQLKVKGGIIGITDIIAN